MYFLKWIIADKLLGLYQHNDKCWGWGGRRLMNMGIRKKEKIKGQSGSSMLTFVVLPDMYVPDILHDT